MSVVCISSNRWVGSIQSLILFSQPFYILTSPLIATPITSVYNNFSSSSFKLSLHRNSQQPGNQIKLVIDMATAASNALSSATVASAAVAVRPQKRVSPKVKFLPGLNPYQGLRSHNSVIALGVPVSTEQCFAKFANSIRANSSSKKGGALSSTCNAAFEIFKIASIMNGLVLVGVAVGFALLRIEATVEEAE